MIHTEHIQLEVALTAEDDMISELFIGRFERYEYRIGDRNDSALMHALTILSRLGSRASKGNLLMGAAD